MSEEWQVGYRAGITRAIEYLNKVLTEEIPPPSIYEVLGVNYPNKTIERLTSEWDNCLDEAERMKEWYTNKGKEIKNPVLALSNWMGKKKVWNKPVVLDDFDPMTDL